jgi:hypothetical protein
MNQQVKRWARAAAAMTAGLLAVNAPLLDSWWQSFRQPGALLIEEPIWDSARSWLGQALAIMVIYVLADQIGRRLLRGRYVFTIATGLFLIAGGIYEWRCFGGIGLGPTAFFFGWQQLVDGLAVPFIAGAWMLWPRVPKPVRDAVSAQIPGVWDSPDGVLVCESDGVFTLAVPGGSTTAGLWERLPGDRPQIVLKIVSLTELGHGWQATVLDLDASHHGAVLRGAAEYRRREAETMLERSTGYVGTVEVLEF